MRLSYVIVTHNRIDALLKTLASLEANTPLRRDEWETFVVDNGSTDGTVRTVLKQFPRVHIIRRAGNEGAGARSYAFTQARGDYLILLDDDSYPIGGAVGHSLEYLDATPSCGALVGKVVLPNGSFEACAFPSVMLSGAVCLRKSAVDLVGPFRPEFFRKAGEYDYSFRLWQTGFSVDRFEDVVYRHDKVLTGRSSALAHRMDLRNNLIIVERFLPRPLRDAYRADFTQRYSLLARHVGQSTAARQALFEAKLWRFREHMRGRSVLSPAALESALGIQQQRTQVAAWARSSGVRRVVISDFSKNLFATYFACERAGLDVIAIADDHPAFTNSAYRGVSVQSLTDALALRPDGVVLSNVNPAQIEAKAEKIRERFSGPMLTLWQGRTFSQWKSNRAPQRLAA